MVKNIEMIEQEAMMIRHVTITLNKNTKRLICFSILAALFEIYAKNCQNNGRSNADDPNITIAVDAHHR